MMSFGQMANAARGGNTKCSMLLTACIERAPDYFGFIRTQPSPMNLLNKQLPHTRNQAAAE